MNLRTRLTLWYTALLSGMLLLLGAAALTLLDRGLRDNVDASLKSVASSIAESVRNTARPSSNLDEALESLFGPVLAERFYRLLDPFGRPDPRLVPRNRTQFPLTPEALHNAEQGQDTYQTLQLPGVSHTPVRLLTMPVIERARIIHFVQVAMPLDSVENARSGFLLILLSLAPVALGGAGIGGWFLARHALAPVDAMVETARKISAEDLSQRLNAPERQDELGRLAEVLNAMLARLEQSFTAVRHFSADAAHELRTPLTILKGELEVASRTPQNAQEYQRVLTSCLEEVDRLSALVEDLLFLARSDSGNVSLPQTTVNLTDLLGDVFPALAALAEDAGVACTITPAPSLWVRGNESLLFRLVFNLGENAVKYTSAGGAVTLALKRSDDTAVLEVLDTGPGITPEEQERIFDRFYRGDRARSRGGTGLGLTLTHSIVLVHGGQIAVDSILGKGSCFRVTLPLTEGPFQSTLSS
ncbi:MAG: HAMP domain-containing protein [Deltaproteobacteria bacterium]|nr:HAMP domain-containing protein [Deltaproteobacteria bacterium]